MAGNATLNGMVVPGGRPTTTWFEWDTNTSYGNRTAMASAGTGSGAVRVSQRISWVAASQPYHCRLVASNTLGVVYGADQPFALAKGVLAWGDNYYRQTNVPADLINVVAIAGRDAHSLALGSDGEVYDWGYNGDVQTDVPANLTNAVGIAGGASHSRLQICAT